MAAVKRGTIIMICRWALAISVRAQLTVRLTNVVGGRVVGLELYDYRLLD